MNWVIRSVRFSETMQAAIIDPVGEKFSLVEDPVLVVVLRIAVVGCGFTFWNGRWYAPGIPLPSMNSRLHRAA